MNHLDMMEMKKRQKGTPLVFRLRGGTTVIDGLPGNIVVLNQDKEMGYAFRRNNSTYANSSNNYEMICFKYNEVNSVTSYLPEGEVVDVLDGMVADSVIQQSYADDIMASLRTDAKGVK